MTERFLEKQLAPDLVARQHAFVLVGSWDQDVAEGTESVSLRWRTHQKTISTNADTTTGEQEVAPPAELPDLHIDTSDLSPVISDPGADPVTGADLSKVSRAGLLTLMKSLYRDAVAEAGEDM